MKALSFERALLSQLDGAQRLVLSPGQKLIVLSDLHMGNGGSRDDLIRNESLLLDMLEGYYLRDGWILVLNGDVEELQRFKLPDIRKRWERLYSIFDRFAERGAFYKIIGNHDEELRDEREYPYPLLDALRVETPSLPLFVYHGHQVSQLFVKYNRFVRVFLRYFLTPLGIRNKSVSKDRRKRFFVERRIYEFSRRNGLVSVLGHTHRPLFESLSNFDFIKFEMERLCRQYPLAEGSEKTAIAADVLLLRKELKKIKRKDRRKSLLNSLYGDELLVPCVFNSGCAISKKGITTLEIDTERISLIYWFTSGQEKKYVRRGSYSVESLEGTARRRVVLNSDRLDYIRARIELLA
ncbi:MAG: serine/threonine protein phosphatase [Treponemataceae bacterium]